MSSPTDLRRLLRQTLELYRGMGLEQLPLVALPSVPPASAATPASPPNAGNASAGVRPPPRSHSGPAAPWELSRRPPASPAESPPSPPSAPAPLPMGTPSVSDTSSARRPAAVPLPLNASPDERSSTLKILQESVSGCVRCTELASTRKNTVFGVGNPSAKILFLGEAPGADEDEQGEPFVGRAGQLLNDIITACQLKREEIYICNVLKCRPPGNRTPLESECTNCREFLDGQLAAIDPEFIVCWGTTAAQNLLQTKQPIGKLRQQFFRHGRARVLCTYHPSYLLRNPPAKKDVWEDMKFWRLEMGIDLGNARKAGS